MTELATIGRYQVVGHLATGGMAELFLSKMLGPSGFERAVVVKRILPHLAKRQEFVDMFLDEARIIAGIRHPNVVHVHELGNDADGLYMVLEYLDGESLAGLNRRLRVLKRTLPHGLGAHVVAETCSGLHAAHELEDADGKPQNLVHRDVSPQNVLVLYNGQVKVLDFGIATSADRIARTEAGQIKGKFSYMSPEQCLGKPLDRRSDIFSLGIVLFELTTGTRLFHRESELKTLKAITEERIVPPSRIDTGYPKALEKVVLKALSHDAEERYETALAMRRDLMAAMRTLDVDLAPEAGLAKLMDDAFFDRIEEKREMLRRIRSGSNLTHIPEAEVDVEIELPAIDESEMLPTPETTGSQQGGNGLRWAMAALVLVAAVGAAILGVSAAMTEPPPPTVEPPAPPAAVAEPPSPAEDLSGSVTLHVDSEPHDVRVLLDGEEMGRTPASLEVPTQDSPITLTLRRPGYEDLVETVTPDVDQRLRLVLVRERRSNTPGMGMGMGRTMESSEMLEFGRFD